MFLSFFTAEITGFSGHWNSSLLSEVCEAMRREPTSAKDLPSAQRHVEVEVAEAPWSVAEWAVAPSFDNPRATAPVLVLG